MRGHEQGLDRLSPEERARLQSFGGTGIGGTWVGAHLGYTAGLIVGGFALFFLIGGGVLGMVLLAAAILIAIALLVRSVMRSRRDDMVADVPARESHLAEADLTEDTRKKALRNFRFRF
jgi:uncharacterized membrane-anchored protein YitT (DUF2179 family)